ncbi:hypothetical protein C3L33_09592, partial [Rhododendron williamsianum]
MFSYRSLLLFTLLTTSTLCFSFSHGETHFPTTQTPPFAGEINEGGHDGVVYLGTKRFLAEGPGGDESDSPLNSSYLVLAAKRTYRRDPLNGFKKYTGGYNITERHYWAMKTSSPVIISILNIRDAISRVHLGDHWMDTCNRNLYFVWCISSSTQVITYLLTTYLNGVRSEGLIRTPNTCTQIDHLQAQETLLRSKEVTSQLVNVVNQVITNVSNINFAPNFTPLFYNQSGPLMPTLCNPYNPDLTNRVCASGEVDLNNATEVWRNYVCQVSANDICTTTGRLTPSIYNQMTAGVNVSYGLYHYGPFLVDLQDCTFARQTFTDIYLYHCPGLQRYSEWIYVGLVMVSVAVMLSLVFWVIYGRERRHRVYTKQFSDGMDRGFEGDKHT